jgi:hypothetical protein
MAGLHLDKRSIVVVLSHFLLAHLHVSVGKVLSFLEDLRELVQAQQGNSIYLYLG